MPNDELVQFWLSPEYNQLMLLLTSVGLALGVPGLLLAIVQIRKAQAIAVEARDAAKSARDKISQIACLVDLSRAATFARDLQASLVKNDGESAGFKAGILRVALHDVRASDEGKQAISEGRLTEMIEYLTNFEVKICGKQNRQSTMNIGSSIPMIVGFHDELLKAAATVAVRTKAKETS